MNTVGLSVEGRTDVPVAARLIRLVGLVPGQVIVSGGKSKLDPQLPDLNASGAHLNWLILRDLDHDAPCAAALVRRLGRGRPFARRISVRVPVREVESWFLADVSGFSGAFAVEARTLPARPDDLANPKQELIQICSRSRHREIRERVPPQPGSGHSIGPGYADLIADFADGGWDPERAARRSPSLERTLVTLRRLVREGIWGGGPSLTN